MYIRKQVLNTDYDIAGSKETAEESRVLVKELAAFALKRSAYSWSVLVGFVSTQTFPLYTMYFPRNV